MNTKKQYVQALTTHRTFIKGNFYVVVQDIFCGNMWNFPEVNSGDCWLAPKQYFSAPVSDIPMKKPKLENVFIRVNGDFEKEAAIELLKSMGYYDYATDHRLYSLFVVGYDDGSFGSFYDEEVTEGCKELKVDKQTFIQPKTIFTLAKEKTYNVDGKELTRVEVEGIIQDLDIKINYVRNILGE